MLITIRVTTTTEYDETVEVKDQEAIQSAIDRAKWNALLAAQVVTSQKAEVETYEEPDDKARPARRIG